MACALRISFGRAGLHGHSRTTALPQVDLAGPSVLPFDTRLVQPTAIGRCVGSKPFARRQLSDDCGWLRTDRSPLKERDFRMPWPRPGNSGDMPGSIRTRSVAGRHWTEVSRTPLQGADTAISGPSCCSGWTDPHRSWFWRPESSRRKIVTVRRLDCDALASAHRKPDCLSGDGITSKPARKDFGAMGPTLASDTVPRKSSEVRQR